MNNRSHWNVFKRHGVTWLDISLLSCNDPVTNIKTLWSYYVGLLAVLIIYKRYKCRPIRVVF